MPADGRRSFAVIGDTSNTAARLVSVAGPQEVLVTRSTWEALPPASRRGEPLGAMGVKGRQQPVEVWRLAAG